MTKKKALIHKDMLIDEIIRKYPQTGSVFEKYNMPCEGCALAPTSTIENEAQMHNVPLNKLLAELNKVVEKSKQ